MSETIQIYKPTSYRLSTLCDQSCAHCSDDTVRSKRDAIEIDLGLLTASIEEANLKGQKELRIAGGEPFLKEDFKVRDGSYRTQLEKWQEYFPDMVICTNARPWTTLYQGTPSYEENQSFKRTVDKTLDFMETLVLEDANNFRMARLSCSADPYHACEDINQQTFSRILTQEGLTYYDIKDRFKKEDFRLGGAEDPLVKIMQNSYLYKRVQVIKEADKRFREKHGIQSDKALATLYFVINGAGKEVGGEQMNHNIDVVKDVFDIPEHLYLRSPVFRYGKASDWDCAADPPPPKTRSREEFQEAQLVFRPLCGGGIAVYISKYESRDDKRKGNLNHALGVIREPADLKRILKTHERASLVTSPEVPWVRAE